MKVLRRLWLAARVLHSGLPVVIIRWTDGVEPQVVQIEYEGRCQNVEGTLVSLNGTFRVEFDL